MHCSVPIAAFSLRRKACAAGCDLGGTQYFREACVGASSDCEWPGAANDWTMTWSDLERTLASSVAAAGAGAMSTRRLLLSAVASCADADGAARDRDPPLRPLRRDRGTHPRHDHLPSSLRPALPAGGDPARPGAPSGTRGAHVPASRSQASRSRRRGSGSATRRRRSES